jgi:hypothetical protein
LYAYTQNIYFPQQSAQQVIANHTNQTWAIAAKASDLGLDNTIGNQYEISGTFTADYSGDVTIGTFVGGSDIVGKELIAVNFSANEEIHFNGIVEKTEYTSSAKALLYFGRPGSTQTEGNVTINSFTVKLVS